MDSGAIITSILASGVLAGSASALIGHVLGARHERSERSRERLLEATERFLIAFDEALTALLDYRLHAHFMLKNRDQAIAAANSAGELATETAAAKPDQQLSEVQMRAATAIYLTQDISDISNPLSDDGKRSLQGIVEQMEDAINALASEPWDKELAPLNAALRSVLRSTILFASSIEASQQAILRVRNSIVQAQVLTARVKLLFPSDVHESVPALAVAAADALATAQSRILAAAHDYQDAMNDPDVALAFQSAREQNDKFVTAAHTHICQRIIS
jgi:hypothetical protein